MMKLFYTSTKSTSNIKNSKSATNMYFNTIKNKTSKRQFIFSNKNTKKIIYSNKPMKLTSMTRNHRRIIRMNVPFSKTRKCGACFRH